MSAAHRRPLRVDDDSTLPPMSLSDDALASRVADAAALIVVWSRQEPERVGEALRIPPGGPGTPWILGRGESAPGAREHRLLPARYRPGVAEPTGPLACPRISRAQLRVTEASGGALLVENVGACPLVHREREVSGVTLAPGELVELRNELLLLYVRRAPMPEAPDGAAPLHPFGEADAFGLVGESPALWELRHRIADVARTPAHVLVLGASGTGKELVAQAIHARSTHGRRALVSRNAATIPVELADAELFGNVRNYPNPGMAERPGLVGEAHGSTLFLDEFAELSPAVQARLLRVMGQGEYQRLGEATPRRADLRFIGATNRPAGDLKHDLLARFKLRLLLPDLNARREDIPLLAASLLRRHAARDPVLAERFFPGADPRAAPRVSPNLMQALIRHRYTTHARELDALLLRAALDGRGRYVELTPGLRDDLVIADVTPPPEAEVALSPEERLRLALLRKHRFSPTVSGRDPAYPGNRQTADLHLRQLVCKALRIAGWDVGRAAAMLAGEGDAELEGKARARVETFLANLRARRAEAGSEEALRRALVEEWKGSAEAVLDVVEALRAGKVRSAD